MATTRTTETVTYDEETVRQRREQFRQREQARRLKYPSAWHDPQYYSDPRNASPATYLLNQAASSPYPEMAWNRQALAGAASVLGPENEQMLTDYTGRGIVSPEMAAGLTDIAKILKLPEETLNALSTLENTLKAAEGEGSPEAGDKNSETNKSGLARAFGSATRPLFAMLSMPAELVQSHIRSTVGGIAEADSLADIPSAVAEANFSPSSIESNFAQTYGGQVVGSITDPTYSSDLGNGWFPGGEAAVKVENARAEAAPLVNGQHWTMGRASMDLFLDDPDSLTYRNLSGLIDLTAAIVMDPLVVLGGVGSGARAAQAGARTAGAVEQAGVARAAMGEQALRSPETWLAPRETLHAGAQYVRQATRQWSDTMRAHGWDRTADRLATATDRYNNTIDDLVAATDDAATPATPLSSAEVASRVQSATENVGNEALGAFSARIAGQSPPVKGVVTDATPEQGSSLIGTVNGVDSIVTVNKANPATVSTDDLFDADELLGTIKSLPGPKQAKDRAAASVRKVRDEEGLANTYENLVDAAARSGSSATLGAALRHQDIDGVTDLFRMTDSEGGVWWVGRDVDVVSRQADGTWAHHATDAASLNNRVSELKTAQRSAAAQRGRATADANRVQAMSNAYADEYTRIMDGLTDMDASTTDAVRTAVEYAMGVRHTLGGKPQVNHDAVKSFFFGAPNDADEALGAVGSTRHKAIRAADRAMIAGATFGFSEAARGAAKAFAPVMARARAKILDDMVTLDDTPANLGRLHRLTNGKIEGDTLRRVLQATNEDEVVEALAPSMGVRVNRPITPNVVNLARTRQTHVSTGRKTGTLLQRATGWMIDEAERLGTIAPRGLVSLNFADPVGSARDLRNYLNNLPGLETGVTDEIMGTYLQATTETGRARAVMGGFDRVFDRLSKRTQAREGWSDETRQTLNRALKDATQVYDGGRAEVKTWWASRRGADAVSGHITVDGQQVSLPGPQLEAELARGGVVLPSASAIRRSIGRYGAFIQEGKLGPIKRSEGLAKTAANTQDAVSGLNDLWRSAVLFRPAYVIRNIGEMQSRMMLAGHSSIFSHPLAVAAFAFGTTAKSQAVRNLANRFNRWNQTATGEKFSDASIDDLKSMDEAVQEFAEATLARTSRLDMRTHRAMEAFHGLEEVKVSQAGFNLGWAEQLLTLRASRVARIIAGADPEEVATAVARGANREDAITNWMLTHPQARPIRQIFADNDPTFARMFGNPRTGTPGDPSALKQFLFTAEGSIKKRMDYYIQGNQELADFIRTGNLARQDNFGQIREMFTTTIKADNAEAYGQAMADRARNLARTLEPFRKRLEGGKPDTALHMRVLKVGREEDKFRPFDAMFDSFFNWAGRMENAWSVGPEFAQAYHSKLAELLPAVQATSRQRVFDTVKKAEGRTRMLSETMVAARAGLKSDRPGSLTVEDVSAMASRHASEHVKTFFYDAMRRQQVFHAMRVVFPFAQSFVDTLWRWGTLAAKRPYVMEKIGRLGTAATEPGSGVIYDNFDYIDPFTNRESSDPNQGVLWEHPQTGETMLTFPLVGSALAQVLSPTVGAMTGENIDLAQSMQLSAPLRNLNIALQGDVDYLPGVGPLVSFPSEIFFPDDAFGAAPEWLRTYLFPYGKSGLTSKGIVESGFFPTWARRLLGFFGNEEQRNYAVKGSMAHLLSTREYPDFRNDPAVAQQLIDDVGATASMMALIRAFGAFGLPAAPSQEIYAADTEGNMIASTFLADRWHNILSNNGRDTEAAIDELGRTYGLETLAAIAGPSNEGEDVPFSGQAWDFFKDHPTEAEPYGDVLGHFFPGDYSFEANQWMVEQNRRRSLSIQERTADVQEFLYFAERRMIEGRSAEEQWTPDQLRTAYNELDQTYANVIPTFEVGRVDVEVEKVRRAVENFGALAATRGGQGAQLALESYDTHKAEAERMFGPGSTLASQQATYLRESFLAELDTIAQRYGGKDRNEGSVETIAQMLTRLVGDPDEEE